MYGSTYVVTLESLAVTAAKSLIEITAPTDASVVLLSAALTQDGNTTSEQRVAQVLRKSVAGTGTAFTARLLLPNSSAVFGGTARTNMTAEGTAGDILWQEGFNLLNGVYYKPLPEERIIVAPSGIIALKLTVSPTGSTNFSGWITFAELG